ncbi:hypothetical protein GCM10020220_106440 [Nonomuraea rubra]|uniref:hypothetical protein n=1 Tax=Nonomuraea rubra TaxID=46180 RepID=UPI0031E9D32D
MTPAKPKRTVGVRPGRRQGPRGLLGPASALAPATDLVASTPAVWGVASATRSLPVPDIGLMSADAAAA